MYRVHECQLCLALQARGACARDAYNTGPDLALGAEGKLLRKPSMMELNLEKCVVMPL